MSHYYQINVASANQHLFRTDEYYWTELEAQSILNTLRLCFPEEKGYCVTISRRENRGEILDW
jgi:hypothetical protein